ncbi:hypothetical protein EOD41_12320 [Mucilaginibacter limnophilus]|uniref:Lipoprotein n=1 Tax=Mucilaginibacter limnophilus TaxID=1932778 RepID=A0A437MRK6_9SPHI|nr:hypothetical protein [Mucilaginibacter limnophilus]RVU00263.1 hypothetical protein EOD41_12320 [Mucilaginibacter limnophilus]
MKQLLFILLLFCFGCARRNEGSQVNVIPVNGTLQISGLEDEMLYRLSHDTIVERWYTLMPVYKLPADTTLKDDQPEQRGTYTVSGSIVLFKPDTAFVKDQKYFLRFYRINKGGSVWDMLKSNSTRPGMHQYTDVIFTP